MPRRIPHLLLLGAVACALLAVPAAAPAAVPKPVSKAVSALRTEASSLPASVSPRVRRRARIAVTAIGADVRANRWCRAKGRLSALRRTLRGRPGRAVPVQRRAALSSRALRVQALLLADVRTKRCGGRKTARFGGSSGASVVRSTPEGITVRVNLPDPQLIPKTGGGQAWEQLVMPGLDTSGAPGQPGVPATAETFAVPEGAKVEVTAKQASGYTLDGVNLYPAQPEPLDGLADEPRFADKPFTRSPGAYASDRAFPKTPAAAQDVGELRDLDVGQLALAGAQYQPKSKKLKVFTSIDVTVKFTGGAGTFGKPGIDDPWERSYRQLYGQLLVNRDTVFEHLTPGSIVARPCGEELLVITSPALRSSADTFAAARNARGILTRVVETGSGSGRAGTTADQIRTFVQGRVAQSGCVRPSYLVLFGNTANVPTFTGDPGIPDIPSDLDYALKFRELYLPNLAVGRIPADSVATADTMVAKITGYENSAPFSTGFYGSATVTGFFQGTGTQDERGFVRTAEKVRNALIANGKTVSRVYTTAASNPLTYDTGDALPAALKKPAFAWNGTGNDVRDQINDGRFFVMHRDHGAPTFVGDPDISMSQISGMTNGALLPVFFSINCSSGHYDDPGTPSFAEQLIRRAGGGAAGVVAASRDSPSELNNRFAVGLVDAIWPTTLPDVGSSTALRRMGDVLNSGKLHVILQSATIQSFYDDRSWGSATSDIRRENRLYQYFGDPTMEIRATRPAFVLSPSVKLTSVVSAALGREAGGAAATLLRDGIPVGRAIVAGDGSVVVNPLEDIATGKLDLVVDQDGLEKTPIPVRDAPATPPSSDAPAPVPPTTTVTVTRKPDLVVTGIRTVTTAPRRTVVTVKNQGTADAGPFTTAFLHLGDPSSAQDVASPGLAAGQSAELDIKGLYDTKVRATVDSKNAVDESNEANNVLEVDNPFAP